MLDTDEFFTVKTSLRRSMTSIPVGATGMKCPSVRHLGGEMTVNPSKTVELIQKGINDGGIKMADVWNPYAFMSS